MEKEKIEKLLLSIIEKIEKRDDLLFLNVWWGSCAEMRIAIIIHKHLSVSLISFFVWGVPETAGDIAKSS